MTTTTIKTAIRNIDNLNELMDLSNFIDNCKTMLGSQLRVGDKVWVVQKTKKTEGTITKMNRTKALVDMRKSYMFMEDAANVVLKLLNEKGTINVGGKSQSVYDFVKESNPNVEPITLSEISDVNMATDCSMDTTKMNKIIGDK